MKQQPFSKNVFSCKKCTFEWISRKFDNCLIVLLTQIEFWDQLDHVLRPRQLSYEKQIKDSNIIWNLCFQKFQKMKHLLNIYILFLISFSLYPTLSSLPISKPAAKFAAAAIDSSSTSLWMSIA